MKNIETKWLYDFVTLEACRHFSQAAEMRNISQPAFSRRIQALESAIGVPLFDRMTVPLQLTEEGKIFHSQARSLLQQLESNLSELLGHNLLRLSDIKIAAAHSLSLTLLPDLVRLLADDNGKIIYYVESIDVVQAVFALREGKSDFVISFHDEDLMQSPFCGLKLFSSDLYPVCATDSNALPRFDIYEPKVPLLNYTSTSYMGRLVNRRLSEINTVSPRTSFMSSMSELLKNMVLGGHGVAWLPMWSIVEELSEKKLVCIGEPELTIPIQAYIYRMDTRLNKTAERFWQTLKNYVADSQF
ncbi:hypochlorite stress DNA-binding transcriptional regulator HypT [Pectobacterium sp. B1J-3]|uniref:hypochlorite stress DNA-binding transcriptional regulator HypT n=1 Tax=Pectobacterium sp. B1J-3 TaxID=3385371 RepID=UPI003905BAAF